MTKLKSIIVALPLLLGFLLAAPVQASPINWTLGGVSFNDGGGASGTFVTDSYTGDLLSYNIVTSAGGLQAGFAYDGVYDSLYCNHCFAPNSFILVATLGNFGDPFLHLAFVNPLTSSGINNLVLGGWPAGSGERNNFDNDHSRVAIGGYATAAAAPEPETTAMLLAGLGLLGFAARCRKQRAA